MHSFICSFICSYIHYVNEKNINKLASFIHSLFHAWFYSLIHLFIYSFIHSCIQSICSRKEENIPKWNIAGTQSESLVYSFIHSINSFIHSIIYSFIHSFLHSIIHSFRKRRKQEGLGHNRYWTAIEGWQFSQAFYLLVFLHWFSLYKITYELCWFTASASVNLKTFWKKIWTW